MTVLFYVVMLLAPAVLGAAFSRVYIVRERKAGRGPGRSVLLGLLALLAFTGLGSTLSITVADMVWFEHTTGYSAGNAPLGWIFIWGPLGLAIAEVTGIFVWLVARAKNRATDNPTQNSRSDN